MFPAAPAIYRRLGWEVVGELAEVAVPLDALARLAPAPEVVLERTDDEAAAAAVYDRWAAAQDGPLTRRAPAGPPPPPGYVLTLARDAGGAAVGYARWRHARRDGTASVQVRELVALTGPAAAALWRMVGSFASVTTAAHVWTSGADATRLGLPGAGWRPVGQWPYGLRLLDVPGALAARGVGPVDAVLPFSVTGDGLDGAWTLTAAGGRATCAPGGAGGPVFSGRGLALAYAGAQSCANLRMAGLLTGPDADDARWDALLGGRPFHVRDYF
jgi:predicted acetyltransferase